MKNKKKNGIFNEVLDGKNEASNQKRFIANMSHEIRTPLNTIVGLNEANLREEIPEAVRENSENILSASKMLLTIVNDILDYSKIDSGKMQILPREYSITQMLGEVVGMSLDAIKNKGLDFVMEISQEIPKVLFGDEIRIKQILINVLSNAVKYTETGRITLRVSSRKMDEKGIRLSFFVEDTGRGMKPESIEHLFDAFSRFDEESNHHIEGTGLGMAITKQLTDLMEGSIDVDSVYGKGTIFNISLPQRVVDETPVGEESEILGRKSQVTSSYKSLFTAPLARILVVDDNAMNRFTVQRLLAPTGITVETAESGQEAIALCKNKEYHVILMDHLMPGMDGIETLRRIRREEWDIGKAVPAVALTANAGEGQQEFYLENGFQAYVVKPINSHDLERVLLALLPEDVLESVDGSQSKNPKEENIEVRRHVKKRVLITTDSFCDLPAEMLESYDIHEILSYVQTGDGHFIDGKEMSPGNFLEYMQKPGAAYSSEPPSENDYISFFVRELNYAENIIHISISEKIGEGFGRAFNAARTMDHVHVIDSKHLSSGQGLVAITAASMALQGESVESILSALPQIISGISTSFVTRSTETLIRSGKLKSGWGKILDHLDLHPVLALKNGRIALKKIVPGSMERVYGQYTHSGIRAMRKAKPSMVFITYIGCPSKYRRDIREEIEKSIGKAIILEQPASAAIGSNCGPGTVGIIFSRTN